MTDMIPVESSNIKEIGYDSTLETLRVMFKTGKSYDYQEVPDSVWQAFKSAPSKGKFFHANIRSAYPGKRVE